MKAYTPITSTILRLLMFKPEGDGWIKGALMVKPRKGRWDIWTRRENEDGWYEQKTIHYLEDLEEFLPYASTLTRQVSDEEIKKEITKHLETLPYLGGYPSDWRETLSAHLGKWMRDQAPVTTSIPSEDQIMKELLDRWGFAEDGAVDCGEQLKIFSFMNWLKYLSNTREVESGWVSVKPEFTEDCWVITRTSQGCEIWEVKKLESDEGWYMGWLDSYGDEYGDLKDMESDTYFILPKPPTKTR